MKFQLHLSDLELQEQDSGLTLGYLSITSNELRVTFFEQRLSMIILDTATLLDNLSELERNASTKILWTGTSNGTSYEVVYEDGFLYLKNSISSIGFEFTLFKKSLHSYIHEFKLHWETVNRDCFDDSVYLTLIQILDRC
jgi:hypothetical protein